MCSGQTTLAEISLDKIIRPDGNLYADWSMKYPVEINNVKIDLKEAYKNSKPDMFPDYKNTVSKYTDGWWRLK